MAIIKQDFTTYAGDDIAILFTEVDANLTPVSIATVTQIIWYAARTIDDAPVLTKKKSTGGITLPSSGIDGKFQVSISAADTAALSAKYLHWATITDAAGKVTTVETGTMTVGLSPIFTYSGDPRVSDKDAVRFWIGDTDSASPQFMDQEILFTLVTYPNPMLAAAQCARQLAARYAKKPNKRVADLSISYGDIAKQYNAVAAELEARALNSSVVPYAGGTSQSDMDGVSSNTDRVAPPFSVRQFDNPRAASQGTSAPSQVPADEQFLPQ